MGVLYSAFPIDVDTRKWLAEDSIVCPNVDGRAPTPTEIATALDSLSGYNVDYNISDSVWQANIADASSPETGMWTLVNVMGYVSPDEPCEFYFEKGWTELIVRILHALSNATGPFALVPDTGCPAVVIGSQTNIETVLSTWEHLVDE